MRGRSTGSSQSADYYAGHMAQYLQIPGREDRCSPARYHRRQLPATGSKRPGRYALHHWLSGPHRAGEGGASAGRRLPPAARWRRTGGKPPGTGRLGRREHRGYLDGILGAARDRGLGNEVHYRGVLELDDKVAFLRGLDLFAVPALYDDPKGLSLIEAMACGHAGRRRPPRHLHRTDRTHRRRRPDTARQPRRADGDAAASSRRRRRPARACRARRRRHARAPYRRGNGPPRPGRVPAARRFLRPRAAVRRSRDPPGRGYNRPFSVHAYGARFRAPCSGTAGRPRRWRSCGLGLRNPAGSSRPGLTGGRAGCDRRSRGGVAPPPGPACLNRR